jgi:hypothetical protein
MFRETFGVSQNELASRQRFSLPGDISAAESALLSNC